MSPLSSINLMAESTGAMCSFSRRIISRSAFILARRSSIIWIVASVIGPLPT
jgi:hypothetical protein